MKSTILLTTALFLASAPSPDAKTISEFSGGFLVMKHHNGLMASEPVYSSVSDTGIPVNLSDQLAQEKDKLDNPKDR